MKNRGIKMEVDKEFIKNEVLSIPGLRQAMRENNYDEVFRLCKSTKKINQLAAALYISKVDFLRHMTHIPESMFRGVDLITEITIPGNIKTIGDLAFLQTGLEKLTLEEGVEEIGDGAFAQTKIKEVYLPRSVKKIGRAALGRAEVYCYFSKEDLVGDNPTVNPEGNTFTYGNVINQETGEVLKDKGATY